MSWLVNVVMHRTIHSLEGNPSLPAKTKWRWCAVNPMICHSRRKKRHSVVDGHHQIERKVYWEDLRHRLRHRSVLTTIIITTITIVTTIHQQHRPCTLIRQTRHRPWPCGRTKLFGVHQSTISYKMKIQSCRFDLLIIHITKKVGTICYRNTIHATTSASRVP